MKRLEFIGKTKSTLEDVDVQQQKMGQKETVPALLLTLLTRLPNTFLNTLDPTGGLLSFCYEKGNPNKAQQATLDGVDVVSPMPDLTANILAMGASFGWKYEQTGCTLTIYRGTARVESNIKLRDCTVDKVKLDLMEGGTVHVKWQLYVADLDAETVGNIAVLKKHELEIELTAPELVSQQRGIADEPGALVSTPEGALAEAEAREAADKAVKTAKGKAAK